MFCDEVCWKAVCGKTVRHVVRRKNCPVTGPMSLENTLRTTPNLNPKGRGKNSMVETRG